MKILIVNGPNLNMLGRREPSIYGGLDLAGIEALIRRKAPADVDLSFYQSNHEGELVERIQQSLAEGMDAIVINPGAYTHTSVAIRDALLAVSLPVVEVHLSNVAKREDFRHTSYVSDIAAGTITGLGPLGYVFAVEYLRSRHD
ncbi:MAG: 3-dehydroquinate dehydratase [Deltaproteobacteria bacterium ADurb.Bin510]|nr:MAG: 3-dehydroquinate dehydratase [Deltaproteobacteria bacterium ADurb.Bin510]